MGRRKRRNPLLARPYRPAEDGRSLRQHRHPSTTLQRPQQQPVRLRSDHPRHATQRLDARGRRWKIPRKIGCQYRTGSREFVDQRKRTVQRPQHWIHDQHAIGSLHYDSRQKVQIQDDQFFRFRVSSSADHPRTQLNLDCYRWWTSSSCFGQHYHFVLW